MKGLQKSFKMVLDSSLYDLSYHSYVCQSTANIVKISPKLRFLDDHNSKNTWLMWLKFGVAKLLCICIDLTKFEENSEGLSFFCVDLTWNDPHSILTSEFLFYLISEQMARFCLFVQKNCSNHASFLQFIQKITQNTATCSINNNWTNYNKWNRFRQILLKCRFSSTHKHQL